MSVRLICPLGADAVGRFREHRNALPRSKPRTHSSSSRPSLPLADQRELERHIAEYPDLGPKVSAQIALLRLRRNAVTHEDLASLSPDEAMSYARRANHIIGQLTNHWPA